jgi:hypothetical protein
LSLELAQILYRNTTRRITAKMANDKEQEQQQHIPTESKEEEKKDQGTGGLLSMVGDPAGLSPPVSPPFLLTYLSSPFPRFAC